MGPRTKAAAAAALVVAAAATILVPAAAHAATKRSHTVLTEGIGMRDKTSVRVRKLQRALVRHGYSVGPAGIDGRFGPRTKKAVRRAQHRHHLKVDGIAGPRTLRALAVGAASRARASRHRRATTTHRNAPARIAAQPVTVPPLTATAPPTATTTPTPPASADRSSSAAGGVVLIVILLAAAAVPLCAYVYRRRKGARVSAGDPISNDSPPSPEPAAAAVPPIETAAEDAPVAAPEPAPLPSTGLAAGTLVIGYVTEQVTNGRAVQRAPERDIEGACGRAGWRLVDIVRDRQNGRILERPGLSHALERIAAGEANALVVNDARLLSRSADFAGFVKWFRDSDAALVALDLGLDTSTPEGSRVAGALITLNGWASDWLASVSHRSATEVPTNSRKRTRTPISERADVLQRIGELDESGMSAHDIAEQLNEEGVPTLFATERWWPSSIQAALRYWRAGSATRREQQPAKGG
jgi:peptidoglycan hydrolase-like protein with peptidoglycan-binding domain/DNA invertase Pin-like site-specific DNA recombinase